MTRRGAVVLDVAVGTFLAAAGVAAQLRAAGFGAIGFELSLAVTLWCGSLALRTVASWAMAVVFAAGVAAYALVPGQHDSEPFLAALLGAFLIGAQLRGRWFWVGVVLLFGTGYPMDLDDRGGRSIANLLITPIVLFGAPLAAGVVLRRSRDQADRLRRLSAELAEERELHARAAAAAERNRISRDLHDVVAHSVSAMVVQAGAAEQQLQVDSPAREQVAALRRTGKETLVELRRQLGVLREVQP